MQSDIAHSQQNVISIWVVDDHKDFRETLQDILSNTDRMRCDRIFSSCEEMLEEIMHVPSPDVVLLDINFPDRMSGIDGVRLLRAQAPQVRVLILSMHFDDDIIFDSLKAGAHGYVFKMSVPEKILKAIESTHAGIFDIPPQMAKRILDTLHPASSERARKPILIQREIEILNASLQNISKQEIAEKHQIDLPTLERHIQSIYRKLHQA